MQEVFRTIERVAASRANVLVTGESGTGKELVAHAIHELGPRAGGPFVAVNCAAIPETLLESELFGHERGAFTGAVAQHIGLFARTRAHGAVFLDEIAEVASTVQVKLLHVLQERSFRPVGSHATRRFEGRVIAATNRPLAELRRGTLRDDLYYRLSADVIEMPTLRARLAEDPAELGVLVGAILEGMLGERPRDLVRLVEATIARDVGPDHPWPGNVRELAQCVRRVLLTRSSIPELAGRAEVADAADALLHACGDGRWSAGELLARYCAALHARLGTYEAVAERVGLDRRTVRRHVLAAPRSDVVRRGALG
jgi:DNA-binding NtrC family response regulator